MAWVVTMGNICNWCMIIWSPLSFSSYRLPSCFFAQAKTSFLLILLHKINGQVRWYTEGHIHRNPFTRQRFKHVFHIEG